jgi:hypothetical protein
MRDLPEDKKEEILRRCMFFCDHKTGRIVRGGIGVIMREMKPVARRTISRLWASYRAQISAGNRSPNTKSKRKGRCGRKSMLTEVLRAHYTAIAQEYANSWLRASNVAFQRELADRGINLSRKTIQTHLKLLKARRVNIRIKPTLTHAQKVSRSQIPAEFSMPSSRRWAICMATSSGSSRTEPVPTQGMP